MTPTVVDPKTTATKPHGTTADQITEMENEGQAATSQATPEDAAADATEGARNAGVESPRGDQAQGAPGPTRSELDKTMSDQDLDTAGTDADKA